MTPLDDQKTAAMWITLWLLPLLALATAAPAQQPRRDPSLVTVHYQVPGTDAVRILKYRTFESTDGAKLPYDAYFPARSNANNRPVVVFVSGAPSVRAWRWFQDHGKLAAAHGFAAFVPDKRFPRGLEGSLQGTADTAAFLKYLKTNSRTFGIDPNRICLWVFSAGGRIAPMAFDPTAPVVECVIGFYPVLDGADQAVSAPTARKVRTLIVRAGRDSAAINQSIDRFVDAALRANLPLTVTNLPDADHGFEGLNDRPFTPMTMRQAYAFMAPESK